MPRPTSPLRYPGGKTCLYPLIADILRTNRLERRHYAEPFAGGCGLALALLYGGHVSDVHVNDIDVGIWAFWHSVLEHTDDLAKRIEGTPITVDEWHRQRATHNAAEVEDPLALGFATLFLNRTNRSGIIKRAGVIGGLDQTGRYKIDCRFNRDDLIRRVRRVARYRKRVHLTRLDAREFIAGVVEDLPPTTFLCVDPPYYVKGSQLYTSFYESSDHSHLATLLLGTANPWVVTYDNDPDIRSLYRERRQFGFDVQYSIETKRVATELLVASKGLRLPPELRRRRF